MSLLQGASRNKTRICLVPMSRGVGLYGRCKRMLTNSLIVLGHVYKDVRSLGKGPAQDTLPHRITHWEAVYGTTLCGTSWLGNDWIISKLQALYQNPAGLQNEHTAQLLVALFTVLQKRTAQLDNRPLDLCAKSNVNWTA
jgi:hypothetical protein